MSASAQLQANRTTFFGQWMNDFLNDPNSSSMASGWLIDGGTTTFILGWCTTTSAALLAGTYDPDLANRQINRYIYGGCTQFGYVNSVDMIQDIVAYTRQNGGQGSWWDGWYGDRYHQF